MDPIQAARGDRDDEPEGEPKRFVARLHARGLSRNAAASRVARVYGVSRAAARLFVASHPSWVAETSD
jgi:hypothetical protein